MKSLLEEKQRMALEVKSGSSSSGSSTSSSTSSSSTSSSSSSSSSEDEIEDNLTEETKSQLLQAKHQYRELKMKLLQSIKENEVLTDELRRHQRKLLRLNRDKYFLFERLLAYEKPPPKQATLKEETIEIVDGVPKVVRVGKKRGPKPKKREKSPPDFDEFASQKNLASYGQLMEPGQSLLKLKSKGSGGRKRGSKKKEIVDDAEHIMSTDSPPPLSSQGTVPSSPSVTFSPGFSKDKTVSSLKRQMQQQQKVGKSHHHHRKMTSSNMQQSFLPSSEISNASDDAIMTFKSEPVPNDPVGGAPLNQSEFFRHDSFSNEMPDNLFDD